MTRPDLSYVFHYLSKSMAKPTKTDMGITVRTMRYLEITAEYGIHVPSLKEGDALVALSDASW